MTPEQCRTARDLLGWTQLDLAIEARCDSTTVKDFENGQHAVLKDNRLLLRLTLEAAGIEFMADDGGVATARLKKHAP